MSDTPNTFEALIAEWGIAQFAADIGVTYSTANAMKQRKSIPAKYWPVVIERAPKRFRLSATSIIAMKARERVAA